MNNIKLSVSGYKCFGDNNDFDLGRLTVLTGANSSGKSSVIQTILLAKLVSETHIITSHLKEMPTVSIDINDNRYALNLGTINDIIYHQTTTGVARIKLGENEFQFDYDDNDNGTKDRRPLVVRVGVSDREGLTKIFNKGFCYLTAEREGPEYQYYNSKISNYCGCHGENLGDIIASNAMKDIDPKRSLYFKDGNKWLIQFDEWVDYIFPGIALRVEQLGDDTYRIKIQGDVSTNVGFGITYAAPIIVSALQIPTGGMLIVENPEAHLHAKAQSNIGYFLARMAAAGLRVIIETHSEHVVNGIRRSIVENNSTLSHDEVSIFFFQKESMNTYTQRICIDRFGNLSAFPIDFFDQVRQDMRCIIESGKDIEIEQ